MKPVLSRTFFLGYYPGYSKTKSPCNSLNYKGFFV